MAMFVLRAIKVNGDEAFYTGRAGAGFISPSIHEAFIYETLEGATDAAKRRDLSSLKFSVLAFDSYDGGE